ncbi:hypothetical protein SAMN04487981_102654 [Streptomyces sp. cf386]|uniref:hypothetical protein n=1 Tax=Streptomyces sp. cf386 TaxID=1761904 RepID=UPI00088EBB23|nr:hypothetical protein SAMN04487981_102654 [Streptomyces sp. cf386]
MDWLSAQDVVAVVAVVVMVVASVAMVWYERRVPRRKQIGYRVQMDSPVDDDAWRRRAGVRLGLFDETPGMDDATLVLLRIENDGTQSIGNDDYTGREHHGLTVMFTDRAVRGVSVTQPPHLDHLMDHFTPSVGFGYQGNQLRLPRVPLNRGDHFKVLVLLSGGRVGSPVRLLGGIRDGEVHPNRAATPDDRPPLFSAAARLITFALMLCVLALAGLVLTRDTASDGGGVPAAQVVVAAVAAAATGALAGAVLRGRGRHHVPGAAVQPADSARRLREMTLLAAVALLGYAIAFLAARPLLDEPHPLGFDASETAQVIVAIAGLTSGVTAGAAAIIKAVAHLTYARADLLRARGNQPRAETGEDPDAEMQPAPGE